MNANAELIDPSQSQAKGNSIAILYRPVADLKLDSANPRLHSRKQIRQIVRSIETFGFNVPILVDKAGQVIAGHGRLLACREMGLTEVPTIALEHLSAAQARAFLLADNQLSLNAEWDARLLGEQLKALSEADLDFDVEVTGFEAGEIDLYIEGLTVTEPAKPEAADDFEAAVGPPVSKVGDLWLLGHHRLLCGNALDVEAHSTLMGKKKAAMVFSDPPYNVPIDGHTTGLGAIHHRDFPMASGEMSEAEFIAFLTQSLRRLAQSSLPGSLHYLCMDWRHLSEMLAAGRTVYSELKNLCVWAKDNPGMGSFYRSQHELILVFKHGSGSHRNNVQLGQFGRNRTNVWRYPSASAFGRPSEEGRLLALHPTVKPIALVADAILDCTVRGDIVLDAFLGSGTTLLAAERVGRRCHAIELDPLYVDTAIRRWQVQTGESAMHATSGRSFDEVARRPTSDAS